MKEKNEKREVCFTKTQGKFKGEKINIKKDILIINRIVAQVSSNGQMFVSLIATQEDNNFFSVPQE